MAHDVFISYASRDKDVADTTCAWLESRGIRCWMVPRDIAAGENWADAVVKAIHAARLLVLIFSSQVNTSAQIKREVERAVSANVPIVPLRVEDIMPLGDLDSSLGVAQWIDAFHPPLEDHLRRLTATVQEILWQSPSRPAVVTAVTPPQTSSGDPHYDVFVSAKSQDYPQATIAANFLRRSGLSVFFSQQELPELGNSDYYSAIDDSLEVARHMLVVTSSRANVDSRWVKKEWQTFLNEKLSGRKTGNLVTLLCAGMKISDLPLSLRQHEARPNEDLASLLRYFRTSRDSQFTPSSGGGPPRDTSVPVAAPVDLHAVPSELAAVVPLEPADAVLEKHESTPPLYEPESAPPDRDTSVPDAEIADATPIPEPPLTPPPIPSPDLVPPPIPHHAPPPPRAAKTSYAGLALLAVVVLIALGAIGWYLGSGNSREELIHQKSEVAQQEAINKEKEQERQQAADAAAAAKTKADAAAAAKALADARNQGAADEAARLKAAAAATATPPAQPAPITKDTPLDELQHRANAGEAAAEAELGARYFDGVRGVKQDQEQAYTWFRKAADQGDAEGEAGLAVIPQGPYGYSAGLDWAQKSADQGNGDGESALSEDYLYGGGVKADYQLAFSWAQKSADQGNARGEFDLGVCYQGGYGVARDFAQARTWFEKAAAQENAFAKASLGDMYENGQGVTKDYAQAFAWYQKAATQGNYLGEYNLARLYENGWGVDKNIDKAVEWYLKARMQGSGHAEPFAALQRLGYDGFGNRLKAPPTKAPPSPTPGVMPGSL